MHKSFDADSGQVDEGARGAQPLSEEELDAAVRDVPRPKSRRKRKLTAEMQTQICAMVSVGCSLRTAARLAGCSEAAIRKLSHRDEAFDKRLRDASVQREVFPLRNIINASQTRWRAAAWYLTRLNPEEYGQRQPNTVTPEMLKRWTAAVIRRFRAAIKGTDLITLRRLIKSLDHYAPKVDKRDEMLPLTMPPPFDGSTDEDECPSDLENDQAEF